MNFNVTQDDQYASLFNQSCYNTFHKVPYQWQTAVGSSILRFNASSIGIKQLCIRPTGGGKTLLFTGIALCIPGITLCITPLLSLGADQTRKLLHSTKGNNKITAFHLDEMPPMAVKRLLTILTSKDDKNKDNNMTEKTILLFSSPQFLKAHQEDFIIHILPLLVFVVIDEIHLVCHFGSSFRDEFALLKKILFMRISITIPVLLLTGTCNTHIFQTIHSLLGITINQVDWPSSLDMMCRNAKINIVYSNRPFPFVTTTLKENLTGVSTSANKVIVYSNSRTKIIDFAEKLKSDFLDMDESLSSIDVITLVGTHTKEEKGQYIRLFLNHGDHQIAQKIQILCATSGVGNAGIDCPDVRAVYRIDFPPSIIDLAQEKGRAGRRDDASPEFFSYNLCISFESFIHLFKRIEDPTEEFIDDAYRRHQCNDLFGVAKLLMCPVECFSIAFERVLGNPFNPVIVLPNPCGYCPFCCGERIVLPISRKGAKHILFELFVDGDHFMTDSRNTVNVINAIRNYPDVGCHLFASKNKRIASPSNIKKFLLVLITAKIITISYDSKQQHVICGLARAAPHSDELAVDSDGHWSSIYTV